MKKHILFLTAVTLIIPAALMAMHPEEQTPLQGFIGGSSMRCIVTPNLMLLEGAIANNYNKVVQALGKGASADVRDGYANPLHIAIKNGNKNIVELLLQHGARVNAVMQGLTPMQRATMNNQEEIISLLIAYGAEVPVNQGLAPMDLA